jgi:GNAT superfamily N-acetyltransferase
VLQIRVATSDDLPAIVELLLQDSISQAPQEGGPSDRQRAAFETIAAHPDHEILVATAEGAVAGTLQLSYIPGLAYQGGWRAQVEGVRVREEFRNLRIGTRLMEEAIRRARARDCRLMQLTTNRARVDAQRFYQRLGFAPSHVGMKLLL